jgi:hypothetical protein
MCRGKASGGRRCPGCMGTEAREAHNRRRRENRAIRHNAAEWAQRQGLDNSLVENLRKRPPAEAKKWLYGRGLDPVDFIDGVPDLPEQAGPVAGGLLVAAGEDQPAAGQGHGPVVVGGSPSAAGPAGVLAGGPGEAAGGGQGAPGSAGKGGMAGVVAGEVPGGAASGPSAGALVPDPDAELARRVRLLFTGQGEHRDEASLLKGMAVRAMAPTGRAAGANETWRVDLDNGMVGYHKPFDGVDDDTAYDFGHEAAELPFHEIASWRLARSLGEPWSDLVPPCVLRDVDGRAGSFSMERAGRPAVTDPWHVPEWQSAAFFDALIGQQDRHAFNYLVAGDRLTLIDHGFSFARPGDMVNKTRLWQHRCEVMPRLVESERAALGRLLDSKSLMGVDGLLAAERRDALVARARTMLETGKLPPAGQF